MISPLFRDPIHDGAADPTLIWNQQEQAWWILYTNRRANVSTSGVAWMHGTDIGIASSPDNGKTWNYRGIVSGLEFETGRNTFWAPEVVYHEGLYHLFASYVSGVPSDWSGERHILHYTSRDLREWSFQWRLELSSNRVIDACIHRLPNETWRMWYKDEANGSHTYFADSHDLYDWKVGGCAIDDCAHEGPNVFFWQDTFWMIIDSWNGLGVYQSPDATAWKRQGLILDRPGTRPDDGDIGRHADVLINGSNAYIFYFTHPERRPSESYGFSEEWPFSTKRSSLQVARLEWKNGLLTCDRDESFDLALLKPESGE